MYRDSREIVNDVELLMKELQKEWEQSSITKTSVVITLEEVEKIKQVIVLKIVKLEEVINGKQMMFKEDMHLTKECYVLLRLARKIKAKEDKTNQKAMDLEFSVPLDKEELKLFKELFDAKTE